MTYYTVQYTVLYSHVCYILHATNIRTFFVLKTTFLCKQSSYSLSGGDEAHFQLSSTFHEISVQLYEHIVNKNIANS